MSIRRAIALGGRRLGMLDLYPMAAGAAWSMRKVRNDYSGSCIRVRRSSDNAEQNIGFFNNTIDTASLLNFAGSGSAFVTTWYDQSGNARNLTMATASRQPRIVNAGVLEVLNGKPAIRFDGADDYLEVPASESLFKELHSAKAFISVVCQAGFSSNPNFACGFADTGGANSTTQVGYTLFFDDRAAFSINNGIRSTSGNGAGATAFSLAPNDVFLPNRQNLLTSVIDNTNATLALRNTIRVNTVVSAINTQSGAISTANSTRTFKVGVVHTTALLNYLNGYVQEEMVYLNDQAVNVENLIANTNGFYNIY